MEKFSWIWCNKLAVVHKFSKKSPAPLSLSFAFAPPVPFLSLAKCNETFRWSERLRALPRDRGVTGYTGRQRLIEIVPFLQQSVPLWLWVSGYLIFQHLQIRSVVFFLYENQFVLKVRLFHILPARLMTLKIQSEVHKQPKKTSNLHAKRAFCNTFSLPGSVVVVEPRTVEGRQPTDGHPLKDDGRNATPLRNNKKLLRSIERCFFSIGISRMVHENPHMTV